MRDELVSRWICLYIDRRAHHRGRNVIRDTQDIRRRRKSERRRRGDDRADTDAFGSDVASLKGVMILVIVPMIVALIFMLLSLKL